MPTPEQLKLIEFADAVEKEGLKTSLYYRLYPQILEARLAVAKAKKESAPCS